MFTLLKNCELYTPNYMGKKDVLICAGKIAKISDNIDLEKGVIKEGMDADVLILNKNLNIENVLLKGKQIL